MDENGAITRSEVQALIDVHKATVKSFEEIASRLTGISLDQKELLGQQKEILKELSNGVSEKIGKTVTDNCQVQCKSLSQALDRVEESSEGSRKGILFIQWLLGSVTFLSVLVVAVVKVFMFVMGKVNL